MMKLELSPRLNAVAHFVPEGARLADIGTDHGYLPVSLMLEHQITSAIAADIRRGPLDHARRTAEEYGLSDQLEFRLCDGLEAIAPEECDVVTVAGMGGETIVGILKAAPWTKKGHLLILQPQSTQDVLRRFLCENGYRIELEYVVREGDRWYPVLIAEGGEMPPLSPGEEVAGRPELWSDQKERAEYIHWLLCRAEHQLEGLRRSDREENRNRMDRLVRIHRFLQEQMMSFSQKLSEKS